MALKMRLAGRARYCRRALFHQGVHAVSVQPEQPPGELPQVIPVRANGKFSRATQSVGSLLF
jgi:hypothetical protein